MKRLKYCIQTDIETAIAACEHRAREHCCIVKHLVAYWYLLGAINYSFLPP
jgi:hypothetical protein